jgi:hypothetical protein
MAGKLNRLAREVSDTKRPLFVTALAGKQIFAGTAAAAGASRLARARFDIAGDKAIIRYAGAKAHLVNNPTKPHRIEPRSRRRGGARRALTFNGVVRAWAEHKGTTGKRFFEAAREISTRELPRVYHRAGVTEPLKRIF